MGERKERVKVRDEGKHIPKENTKHNVHVHTMHTINPRHTCARGLQYLSCVSAGG